MLFVEHILKGSNAQKLTKVIMNSLFNARGLKKVEVPFQLLCVDANGVNTFQGVQGGVIV
jgi:hypothetical protein